MKKSILFKALLATLLLILHSLRSFATDYDFSAVNDEGTTIYYNITSSEEKTVEVTAKYYNSSSNKSAYTDDVVIPSNVEYDGITYSVTNIGDYAFYYCKSLTSIDIPSSVSNIGESAFQSSSLTSIEIPNGVTSISNCTFYFCTSLTSIELPNGLTSIGEMAFVYCTKLTTIKIPDGVTSIGNRAFDNCSSLTSIDIPNSVTSIGDQAFYWCTSLTSIELSSNLTSIGGWAFCNCNLTSIEIPSSVTSIGYGAFNSSSMATIEVATDNNYYCSKDGVLYSKDMTKLIQYPGGSTENPFEIPSTVTSIEGYAFYGTNLTSIEIPSNVTSIGEYAFYGTNLISIEIPNNVTSIGEYAFGLCYYLSTIVIQGNITIIGEGGIFPESGIYGIKVTFGKDVTTIPGGLGGGWFNLSEIYSLATTPPTCSGNGVFNGISDDCVLYVPAGSEEAYGNYSSDYSYTWSSLSKIRTFHPLDITMEEADTVDNHISGYGYTTFYNGKYAYTLPTGMKATTIQSLNDDGVPTMGWEYDGDNEDKAVIPANTAVVIYGNVDDYMLMVDYDETATDADKYGVISSDGTVPDV
ncbi:MAG: leucine-rich repeat domain-containing protein, partial [Prevotella sp.]|nr:leucine-rich repeat domain-containing protein [Prevotella sp.]